MLTLQELITEANKHIISNNPPEAPTLDTKALRKKIGSDEMERLLDCIQGEKELPTIQFYKSTEFMYLEYVFTKARDGKDIVTTIMKDQKGEVHSVIKIVMENDVPISSDVEFTKELD